MNTVSASSQKAEGLCMQTMSGDLSPAMQRPSALASSLKDANVGHLTDHWILTQTRKAVPLRS